MVTIQELHEQEQDKARERARSEASALDEGFARVGGYLRSGKGEVSEICTGLVRALPALYRALEKLGFTPQQLRDLRKGPPVAEWKEVIDIIRDGWHPAGPAMTIALADELGSRLANYVCTLNRLELQDWTLKFGQKPGPAVWFLIQLERHHGRATPTARDASVRSVPETRQSPRLPTFGKARARHVYFDKASRELAMLGERVAQMEQGGLAPEDFATAVLRALRRVGTSPSGDELTERVARELRALEPVALAAIGAESSPEAFCSAVRNVLRKELVPRHLLKLASSELAGAVRRYGLDTERADIRDFADRMEQLAERGGGSIPEALIARAQNLIADEAGQPREPVRVERDRAGPLQVFNIANVPLNVNTHAPPPHPAPPAEGSGSVAAERDARPAGNGEGGGHSRRRWRHDELDGAAAKLARRHPTWRKKDIAEKLGVSPSRLSDSRRPLQTLELVLGQCEQERLERADEMSSEERRDSLPSPRPR